MKDIIEIFKELTLIPRCSKTHKPFIEYLKSFAKKYDYLCLVDEYNNVLCKKADTKAKLSIQSHYDIVCLIDNDIPEIVEKDGYLMAKNSTLGADNGIGCAYMLGLMQQNYNCEFLFTSDEEIGLIGANNLAFDLNSSYLLNLDSEVEGEICIGCAGGVDIFGKFEKIKIYENVENLELYEVSIKNLIGGHSGVNIGENRPNAIKMLVDIIKDCEGKILDISGGERINSIPANAKAIIASKVLPISNNENIEIKKLDTKCEHFNAFDNDFIDFISNFKNGVISFNDELNCVQTSINLSLVNTKVNEIGIELSARSLSIEELNSIKNQTLEKLKKSGFKTSVNDKYNPWQPQINDFSNKVLEIYKKHSQDVKFYTIHAGLETALFKERYPHLKLVSIGPNIFNPHSKSEKVEIKSVENLYKIILNITKNIA